MSRAKKLCVESEGKRISLVLVDDSSDWLGTDAFFIWKDLICVSRSDVHYEDDTSSALDTSTSMVSFNTITNTAYETEDSVSNKWVLFWSERIPSHIYGDPCFWSDTETEDYGTKLSSQVVEFTVWSIEVSSAVVSSAVVSSEVLSSASVAGTVVSRTLVSSEHCRPESYARVLSCIQKEDSLYGRKTGFAQLNIFCVVELKYWNRVWRANCHRQLGGNSSRLALQTLLVI